MFLGLAGLSLLLFIWDIFEKAKSFGKNSEE
jgi:hypothetical protein